MNKGGLNKSSVGLPEKNKPGFLTDKDSKPKVKKKEGTDSRPSGNTKPKSKPNSKTSKPTTKPKKGSKVPGGKSKTSGEING